MRDLMAVLKALADENRVRTLLALGAEGTLRLPDRRVARPGPIDRLETHGDPQTGEIGG